MLLGRRACAATGDFGFAVAGCLLVDDLAAELDAFVADVDAPGPAIRRRTCSWFFPQNEQ